MCLQPAKNVGKNFGPIKFIVHFMSATGIKLKSYIGTPAFLEGGSRAPDTGTVFTNRVGISGVEVDRSFGVHLREGASAGDTDFVAERVTTLSVGDTAQLNWLLVLPKLVRTPPLVMVTTSSPTVLFRSKTLPHVQLSAAKMWLTSVPANP